MNAAEHNQVTPKYEAALARKDTPQAMPDDELVLSYALVEKRITTEELQKRKASKQSKGNKGFMAPPKLAQEEDKQRRMGDNDC